MIPSFVREIGVAFCLLSRLPMPALPAAAFERSARSVWAYPLVGATLGLIAGGVGAAALWAGLPVGIAAGLTLAALMLSTGAMHEDGLADTADGFWGGFDRDRRLEIMKDSQIGTYGTLSLIVTSGLRWAALAVLLPAGIAPVIVAACLSRAAMPVIMRHVPHARGDGLSHSVGRPAMPHVFAGLCIAVLLGAVLSGPVVLVALALGAGLVFGAIKLTQHKIGGHTGDVLGATQVITELLVLLTFIVATP
ncbi:cobalamin 5'-phosphate synthase [Roseobacter denitrificans OCh 114]|uniref:Adenosylcobinamide-GDP ribazoletransferase n=2 Tax=Roseobacter denitrificans TaxID=2434 RepID=Q169A1_ROSDO|nr:cobalamin 5'-phosphate synthase [Roseobacter denitrificans OCh 114]